MGLSSKKLPFEQITLFLSYTLPPGSSIDVALPFTVLQLFPTTTARSSRRVGEEQKGLYLWAEGLLDR